MKYDQLEILLDVGNRTMYSYGGQGLVNQQRLASSLMTPSHIQTPLPLPPLARISPILLLITSIGQIHEPGAQKSLT